MTRIVLLYRCGHHTVVTVTLRTAGSRRLQAAQTKSGHCRSPDQMVSDACRPHHTRPNR